MLEHMLFLLTKSGKSKVHNDNIIAIALNYDILRLQVSVDDA